MPFTELLSISDDDLCSDCVWCAYSPGMHSSCHKGWPGLFDEDGYCYECEEFTEIDYQGQNWVD